MTPEELARKVVADDWQEYGGMDEVGHDDLTALATAYLELGGKFENTDNKRAAAMSHIKGLETRVELLQHSEDDWTRLAGKWSARNGILRKALERMQKTGKAEGDDYWIDPSCDCAVIARQALEGEA